MARKRVIKRYLVTIEQLDESQDGIEHQQPPELQTRGKWWPSEQQKREQRAAEKKATAESEQK